MRSKTYDFIENKFIFDDNIFHFIIHLNISLSQAHFDKLREFLQFFTCPPSMVFHVETPISINSFINDELPGYIFVNLPSPTKAGVLVHLYQKLCFFSVNESFCLYVQGCEDLWFELPFPGHKEKYIFAVIYRLIVIPLISLIRMLDKKLNTLKRKKVFKFGEINFDSSSLKLSSSISGYIQIIESNAFSNLITKPIRVTCNV